MADAVRIEIALPKEDLEKALQRLYMDSTIPCMPAPIEIPPGLSLWENEWSEESKKGVDALRRALRIIDELETMGRMSPTGRRLNEDLPPVDKLAHILQKIYSNDWENAEEAELAEIRLACEKKLKVFEGMQAAVCGRYSAVFRLEVPIKNRIEMEAMANEQGSQWVLRTLGTVESRPQGTWLSKLVRGKK